uniref:GAF domain-containing protein n=1 Tax=Tetradesmus obliquus TaxID=3088 RepID=A0A383VAX6_TETOB|eukprot:jgi/Sobl393_1/15531/SZX62361.1
MGQLQSCLSGQQAVDAGAGKDAQQRSKLPAKAALPTVASAPANPAASAQKSVFAITSSAAQQQPEQAAGKTAAGDAAGGLAGATPLAGNTTAAAAAAGQTGQTGQSKKLDFDPHQTQPGQLGAPVLPGAPHNPHLNGPPRPPCEDERLEVAEQISELLDAAPKKELENILSLVCSIFGVGNALIALFGDRRIYILNTIGGFKAGDFPWRWSFCGWTMASEQHSVMVINDALEDARFHDNKYVQELGVRFYCGAPLVSSSGHRLGTLCFADSQPRVFDTSSLQILVNFAELVTRELEKDISLAKQQLAQASSSKAERAAQYKLMLRTLDCVTSAVLLVDTSKPDWTIVHANSGWQRLLNQCAPHSRSSFSSNISSNINSMPGSRHEGEWQSSHTAGQAAAAAAAAAAGGGGSDAPPAAAAAATENKLEGFCCGVPPGSLQPIGEEKSNHAAVNSSSSSELLGRSLWSLVDGQVLAQLGSHKSIPNSPSSSSSSSSGSSNTAGSSSGSSGSSLIGVGSSSCWCPGDQIVEQVRGRQSFTLRGVKLSAGFGGASAQLSFR